MSPLSRAIVKEQWTRVHQLCHLWPAQASLWSTHDGFFDGTIASKVLPLHQALVQGTAPLSTIQLLIRANPAALVQAESSYERLPLHCACRKRASLQVVVHLVQAYPQACLMPDALQRLPLHYALSNGAESEVIEYLLHAAMDATHSTDVRGFTPLHIACAAGASPEIIARLLDAHPQAVLMRSKSGFAVHNCLPLSHPQRPEILSLLQDARERVVDDDEEQVTEPSSPPRSSLFHHHHHHHHHSQATTTTARSMVLV